MELSTRSRIGTALACVAATVACLAASAHARPGDLDPSFSRNGLVMTSVGKSSHASAVAIQADGKIVVVGSTERLVAGSRVRKLLVARYRRGGRLDPAFSSNGRLSANFGGASVGYVVALQPDGKIVVLGWGRRRGSVLARLHPGGSLDRSFSGDGWLMTDFGDYSFGDVALDGDGRIVLAGTRYGPGFSADAVLARFRPDGAPDTSFSGDGVAIASFAGYAVGTAVAVEPGGKPVLGVEASTGGPDYQRDQALARFEPDGDLDQSFAGDGTTTRSVGPIDNTYGLAIRPDGRAIVAGGACSDPSELYGDCGGSVAQFDPDGSFDDSFGRQGLAYVPGYRGNHLFGGVYSAVVAEDGGTVLAVGTHTDRQDYGLLDFAVARLDATGSLDASFRGKGIWTTDFQSQDDGASDVALQQDGRIVAAGSAARLTAGRASSEVALARYEVTDGPRDADADGVRDGADRCPTRFGSGRQGCRHYARSLTMERRKRKDLFLGELRSSEPGCIDDQRIRVLRARRGRDFEVDTTRTDGGGGWEIDARLHPGRYYAVAPPSHGGVGRCLKARADGFRI